MQEGPFAEDQRLIVILELPLDNKNKNFGREQGSIDCEGGNQPC
jgi:hypothetical protein